MFKKILSLIIGDQLSEDNYYFYCLLQTHANHHQLDKHKDEFLLI